MLWLVYEEFELNFSRTVTGRKKLLWLVYEESELNLFIAATEGRNCTGWYTRIEEKFIQNCDRRKSCSGWYMKN